MESTLELQVLTPIDWPLLKAARLDALRDSPHAFMSRYDVEGNRSETEWRRSIETATWIIARDAERAIGLARSVLEPARPSVRFLESIWVDPGRRRRGVFRALLHRLAELERHKGAADLLLWVLEDNHTARHVYAAVGFRPTGERQLVPALGRFELQLCWPIRCHPDPASP